jgi:hypothetical protein
MKKEVGLWIDYQQAVLVTILDQEEEIKRIPCRTEKYNAYYDDVISYLRDATSILILGPGEAKIELQKRLEDQKLSERVVAVETKNKMTDEQIAVEVRQHFLRSEFPNLTKT